jgi:hypothetical protein
MYGRRSVTKGVAALGVAAAPSVGAALGAPGDADRGFDGDTSLGLNRTHPGFWTE